jgi:hypothetical protein
MHQEAPLVRAAWLYFCIYVYDCRVRVTWRELYVLQSTILLHTNNRKLIAIPFREREGVIQVGEGGGRVWHGKRKKRSRVGLYREREGYSGGSREKGREGRVGKCLGNRQGWMGME